MPSYSKYLLIGLPVLALAGFAALWWQRRKGIYKAVGRVSDLFVYPVKSCKGIQLTEAKCCKEGIEFDRSWVILDAKDNFADQRKYPKLALVVPHFEDDKLCVDAPKMNTLKIDLQTNIEEFKKILIWETYGEGQYVGDEAAEWFSTYLEKPGCKMYQLSIPRKMQDDEVWADVSKPGDETSFSDFGSYLVTAEESLDALNKELASPISMNRFRPNIVVRGLKAFGEDKWVGNKIKIGGVDFRFLKRCGRCTLPNINQELGVREGKEPLDTLKRVRIPEDQDPRDGSAPLFGIYVTLDQPDNVGVVSVGDAVMICS